MTVAVEVNLDPVLGTGHPAPQNSRTQDEPKTPSRRNRDRDREKRAVRFTQPASLAQLPYASLLYHWGFLLPCREVRGFLVIDVNTLECFSVKIRQGHEPVIVFATPVFFASRDLGFGYRDFSHRGPIVIRFLGMAVGSFRRGSRVRFH
jgi:hypothetical protein